MTEPGAPAAAPAALRIVFAGTPQTAVPALRRLAAGRHTVVGVLTREDAPRGRRHVMTASDVACEAENLALPVVKANRPGDAVFEQVRSWRADLGVVVAYGALIREPLLSWPRHGWINLHFSALPRWRGAAPVQRAILAGDRATALDVFRLVPELDAGDILASHAEEFLPDETAGEALERLAALGAEVLSETVDAIADGTARARPQQGEATSAGKLTRADGRLDWRRPAADVYARFRAVTPEPGAFTVIGERTVKIHGMRPVSAADAAAGGQAALEPGELAGTAEGVEAGVVVGTGTTPLVLTSVQPAGRRIMPAADWWRGAARSGRPRAR